MTQQNAKPLFVFIAEAVQALHNVQTRQAAGIGSRGIEPGPIGRTYGATGWSKPRGIVSPPAPVLMPGARLIWTAPARTGSP
ncbi:hypothetical protein ACM25O_13335 [Sulfitobacter pontiacus]